MCCWPLRSAFGVIPTTPPRMLDAGPHFDNLAEILRLNPSPLVVRWHLTAHAADAVVHTSACMICDYQL